MGNQNKFPGSTSFVKETHTIHGTLTYTDANGACTAAGEGVGAATDTDTGSTAVALDESWPGGIVGCSFTMAGAVTDDCAVSLENDSTTGASPHFDLLFFAGDGAGTAADPPDGAIIYFSLTLGKHA